MKKVIRRAEPSTTEEGNVSWVCWCDVRVVVTREWHLPHLPLGQGQRTCAEDD